MNKRPPSTWGVCPFVGPISWGSFPVGKHEISPSKQDWVILKLWVNWDPGSSPAEIAQMTLKLCRSEGGDQMHCGHWSLAQQAQFREPAWMEGRLAQGHCLSLSLSLEWSLGKQNLDSRAKGHFFRCYKGYKQAGAFWSTPCTCTDTTKGYRNEPWSQVMWSLISPHQWAQGCSYRCLHLSFSHHICLFLPVLVKCPSTVNTFHSGPRVMASTWTLL